MLGVRSAADVSLEEVSAVIESLLTAITAGGPAIVVMDRADSPDPQGPVRFLALGQTLPESLAAAAWAAAGGAAILRVHDVGATRRSLAAWTAIDDCGTTAGNADREEIPA